MSRILAVDDDENVGAVITMAFENFGHEVRAFTSGSEALAAYASFQPELVFLDLMMPEMNGLEVLRQLIAWNPDLTVIILSGVADESIAKEAMDEGAQDFITKPFELKHLQTVQQVYLPTEE